MPPRQSPPLKVFLSYSHKDRQACEELQKHLTPLEDSGLIKVWVDSRTPAGDDWEKPIEDNLNAAEIIILLLSPNFANSPYCKKIEMKRACERADNREARLIPILYDHFKWEAYPQIEKRKLLPLDARPVVDWGENRNRVWKATIDKIEEIANGLRNGVQGERNQKSVGSLIPYQVNRNDQNKLVEENVDNLTNSQKSLLWIAHGQSRDCLGDYIQVLCHHQIPRKLGIKNPIEPLSIPVSTDDVITSDHDWWRSLINYLETNSRDSAVKKLRQELGKKHRLIWFELKTSYLGKQPGEALKTCVTFAAELQGTLQAAVKRRNLMFALTIDYDASRSSKAWFRFSNRDDQVRNLLASPQDLFAADNLECIVLPEMQGIKRSSVEDWAKTHREYLNDDWTKRTVDELYSGSKRKMLSNDSRIPMEDLAAELAQYLKPTATS